MRLHLLGLPHTVTRKEYSSCAFTMKILRMSPMVRSTGNYIIHYGVEGSTSGANESYDVITLEEQEKFIGKFDPNSREHVGKFANVGSDLYSLFNQRLNKLLKENTEKGDIILLPFGAAHNVALEGLNHCYFLESGIGYNQPCFNFRVYESRAWLHHIAGKEIGMKQQDVYIGSDYHWVIPNYYDLSDWNVKKSSGSYVLFMGRIMENKGLGIISEVAKNLPEIDFVLTGHGDPTPFLKSSNIHYLGPVPADKRAELMANAICTLAPSRYLEPFCGVAVESMLCGTPAIGSSFGAFTETIEHGISGFRCRTLGDWINAILESQSWDRARWKGVKDYAQNKYDMYKLAHDYQKVFTQLTDLGQSGWYTKEKRVYIHG